MLGKKSNITAHMLVKNEERFVWFAIKSIVDHVDQIIIYDTGSSDKTVEIIQSIQSEKISLQLFNTYSRKELTNLRNKQISQTLTDWILVVDGDEIYPQHTIQEIVEIIPTLKSSIVGVVVPFYNWCGDVFHVQSESRGLYQFGEKKGHLNLRGIKKTPDLSVVGDYPLEAYMHQGNKIQAVPKQLHFLTQKYFHAGDLVRSTNDAVTFERKQVVEFGSKLKIQLPEVLYLNRPKNIFDPLKKRSLAYTLMAAAIAPLKMVKRKLV
jgi:glycosyltransferase involved in cell wall biosynthesis